MIEQGRDVVVVRDDVAAELAGEGLPDPAPRTPIVVRSLRVCW